jgi:uncharacterized membrane protein
MMSLFSKGTEITELLFARPMSMIIWAAVIVAIIAITALLYRRERGLKLGLRITLITMRIAILLLIVVALFEPTVAIKETHEKKRSLAVLVDGSKSMSIRDQRKTPEDVNDAAVALGFLPVEQAEDQSESLATLNTKQRNAIAAATRLELATGLLGAGAPLLESLSEDLSIRYYSFGESLEMLGNGNMDVSEEIANIKADRQGTSLAASIEEVATGHRSGSLAGIILLSDGIETSARQPEAVAHDLGIRGIPIYTLPTGIADPDDVSIRNVIVQDVAFVGDTVPIRVQIRSRGYEKRNTELVVTFNEKEVARENVVLEGGLQYVDVAFDARVRAKGAVSLEIEVQPFMDEATAENNKVARSVRVVNEKINVLCIEGSARWEFRYLRAVLKRDPRINATFIATRAGNELAMHSSDYIARFPEDAEDAFKYDLVILGDVDSTFFTPGEFSRLEELVRERGGSLLMLAGPRYSPSSYQDTAVERMLPVRFNGKDKWRDVGKTVYPVLTPEGRSSLVLTLEMDRDKNDRIWTHVSPMDRIPPLLEARPGASVLATLSDSGARISPYPLISWQRYGTGKCMLMATDRLWRLRFRTGDKYHWRVWSQCIQFLTLSRLMGEHKQIRMETDRVSYPEGSQVRVYAEVLDDGYEPVLQERYDVYVGVVNDDDEGSNKSRVSLRPDSTRPGLYVGYYTPLGAGRYRIQAGEDDLDYANTIEFQVADIRPELANTDMQIESLQRIAKLSGGKCLKLSEIQELATLLDRTPQETVIRREQSLWDNWFFAILIIGLAGAEWIVRRRFDLL